MHRLGIDRRTALPAGNIVGGSLRRLAGLPFFVRLLRACPEPAEGRAARIDRPQGGHPERSEGSAFHSDSLRLRSGQAWLLTPVFWLLLVTCHSPLVTALSAQITPQSIITTVAGGSWQFRGDGGPATSATLNVPIGIAVDLSGNLYVADTGDHRRARL